VEEYRTQRDGGGQTGGKPFQPDHTNQTADTSPTAVQPGPSAPDESSDGRAGDESDPGGYEDSPEGCNCADFEYVIPGEQHEDPRTGEVTPVTGTRKSTSVYCPVHGVNERFRKSSAEHAGWLARRSSYRRCDLYHVTVKLHPEDVENLGLSPDDTKPVLSQLTDRLRQRMRRKHKDVDEDAEVLVTMSPRPKDGQWHLHLLVLSKECSTADVRDVFTLDGVDVTITTPRSREENRDEPQMDAESFAVVIGNYLFQNRVEGAVQGADTKMSAWGDGVGYTSARAKERRQRFAEAMAAPGGDSAPARCNTTQFRTQPGDDEGSSTDDDGHPSGDESENESETPEDESPPPIRVGVEEVQSEAQYRRTVMRALMDRMHTAVNVRGMGRCKMTWAEVAEEGVIVCYVRPLEKHSDDRTVVSWRRVEAVDTPVIRRSTDTDPSPTMQPNPAENDTEDTDTSGDGTQWDTSTSKAEKYVQNARHSRTAVVLPDGRHHVIERKDGEVVRDEKIPAHKA